MIDNIIANKKQSQPSQNPPRKINETCIFFKIEEIKMDNLLK